MGSFVKAAAVGAASGAIGAWTGVGAFGALKGPLGLFGGGLVSAAAGGLTGGFVSGTGNALAGGANFKQAVTFGVHAAAMSAAISSVLFVAGYGVAKTAQALKEARATQQAGGTHTPSGASNRHRIVVGALEAADGTPLETPTRGLKVYRVWGDDGSGSIEGARPWGRSWTTVDPRTTPDFRGSAGLYPQNTGRFVSEGILQDATGVTIKPATYGPSTKPGTTMVPEVVVPNPEQQIQLQNVYGVNPEY